VVAEALAVFTDRGSEFSSAACVDGWDWGVPWAALGRARITPSSSRYFALKVELVDR
jgi:hypothetical protein